MPELPPGAHPLDPIAAWLRWALPLGFVGFGGDACRQALAAIEAARLRDVSP